MASPISVESFIRATQNQILSPLDGCQERIAIDLGVRPNQIVIEVGKRPLRFSLIQPGHRAIHLDYHHPNARPSVHE